MFKYNAKKIAEELLKGNGYYVVPKIFSKKDVKIAREQIIEIAKSYKASSKIKNQSELSVLSVTNHVWNLIDKHAVFRKLVQHDLIIEVFTITEFFLYKP